MELSTHIKQIYSAYLTFNEQVSRLKAFDVRRVRRPNFPECVSEYIVYKVLNDNAIRRDISSGDLVRLHERIEVKCTQHGPISFGPTERWDHLYILHVDRTQYRLYHIALSNLSDEWKSVKVTKLQTFSDQASQGRRPRLTLGQLLEQVPHAMVSCGIISDILKN